MATPVEIVDRGTSGHDERAARESWYRQQGWWTGERLQDRYARIVERRPEALAVIDDRGRRLSHRELWQGAADMATRLAALGAGPGEVVLIVLPNWAEWQVAFLAVLRLGAIPANIPIRTDADNLAHAFGLVGARAAIVADREGAIPIADVARAAADAIPHRLDFLVLDDAGGAVEHRNGRQAVPAKLDYPALDHIMFTSSTTGKPKAVMHSADTLAALNLAFSERFGLGPERPIFMASPLGHSVGTIHGVRLSLYNGAPLVLQRQWDPEAALALIEREGCAFSAAATPFLKDLADAPWQSARPKLAPMMSFLCGGAQVPPALMERATEIFPDTFVTVLWGMTEGGLTTCVPESPREKLLATAGIGLPGLEVRAIDAEARPLAAGEEGELAMRGPGVFIGYGGQDELYRSLLTGEGYFRTGDLARIDAEGYVRITGRLKDLIVRGGVNISPVPIEDAIAAHPAVESVAVIGSPDARLGERICAVIVAAEPAPGAAEIIDFVKARGLPKSFWPERVRTIDAMPTTPAGKIRKNEVRAWLAERRAAEDAQQ